MIKALSCVLSLLTLVFPINCNADVKSLNKGDAAPYTGFLFSPEAEAKVRLKVELYGTQERYIELYKQENTLLQERVELWKKESLELNKELFKKNDSFWSRFGIFLIGAGTAIAIGYTYREVQRR